jgi:hypothetical protein
MKHRAILAYLLALCLAAGCGSGSSPTPTTTTPPTTPSIAAAEAWLHLPPRMNFDSGELKGSAARVYDQ